VGGDEEAVGFRFGEEDNKPKAKDSSDFPARYNEISDGGDR